MIEQQRIAQRPPGHRRTAQDRCEPPAGRAGPAHRAAAPRTPTAATGRATRGGRSVAGLRLRVRRQGRGAAAPGLPNPPLPPPGRRIRPATGPATRPAARHGAASLAHCAGVDLKTVQAQLGHSSIVLTADTYTSVLTDLLAYAAKATAKLVLAAAARNPGHRHRRSDHPAKSAGPAKTERSERPVTRRSSRRRGGNRAAHMRPTEVPQRSRAHSPEAIRPGETWCAA